MTIMFHSTQNSTNNDNESEDDDSFSGTFFEYKRKLAKNYRLKMEQTNLNKKILNLKKSIHSRTLISSKESSKHQSDSHTADKIDGKDLNNGTCLENNMNLSNIRFNSTNKYYFTLHHFDFWLRILNLFRKQKSNRKCPYIKYGSPSGFNFEKFVTQTATLRLITRKISKLIQGIIKIYLIVYLLSTAHFALSSDSSINTNIDFSLFTENGRSILTLMNRDNVLREHQHHSYKSRNLTKPNFKTKKQPNLESFTNVEEMSPIQEEDSHSNLGNINTDPNKCPSCQGREKAKQENLESIKMHILTRLHLTHQLPNITLPITVPQNIIENFYNKFGGDYNRSDRRHHENPVNENKFKKLSNIDVNHKNDKTQIADNDDTSLIDSFDIQNDDPQVNSYLDDADHTHFIEDDNLYRNFDEPEYSRVNNIYIFPTLVSRVRHNRKLEVLNYKFINYRSDISKAIFHIYMRGREWMKENFDADFKNYKKISDIGDTDERANAVVLTFLRAIRRTNSSNYTHTIKLTELTHQVPIGRGAWVQIELDQLTKQWIDNGNPTISIIIKGLEPWMRSLIVTSENSQKNPYLEIQMINKHRHKRSTSLDCQESDNEVRCCRYPLKVNFTNFGWKFVVAPTSFDAYFCNGECKVGYLEQYTHTHLASLTTSATPCCSPTKMSSLSLLYFNLDHTLVLSTIPNMSVEKCSCS